MRGYVRRHVGVLLTLIVFGGCSPKGTVATPPPGSELGEPPIEVTVEHVQDRDAWRVTYALARPRRALTLARPARATRAAHWKVVAPAEAAFDAPPPGPCEQIARRDGAPLTRVVVEIERFLEIPEKDYPVFLPYSDGSTLVYTGHFDVGACGQSSSERARSTTRFHLRARAGESVVVGGRAPARDVDWTGALEGTYAYFGSVRPITTPYLAAVVDPGLPPWMRIQISALVPNLFAYYAQKIHRTLDAPPVVFMSFGEAEGAESRSLQGGTLPGLIQLDVRLGASYRDGRDPSVVMDIARLVAHEAAHLWNAQMFESGGENRGGDWMHEGGADAFMVRALRDLGVVSAADYKAALSEALSLCAVSLRGEPLRASSRPGRTKNYYWCGSTLALWTEAAYAKARPSDDLYTFWRALFDATGATRSYDEALYFRVLGERAPDAARAMERFVREGGGDAAEVLRSSLEALGVATVADDAAASPLYTRLLTVRVAEMLGEGDGCRNVRAEPRPGGASLGDATDCATFPHGARLTSVEGRSLETSPADAWDALALRCRAGGTVRVLLAGEAGARSIPCPQSVRVRGRYLRIVSAPGS